MQGTGNSSEFGASAVDGNGIFVGARTSAVKGIAKLGDFGALAVDGIKFFVVSGALAVKGTGDFVDFGASVVEGSGNFVDSGASVGKIVKALSILSLSRGLYGDFRRPQCLSRERYSTFR